MKMVQEHTLWIRKFIGKQKRPKLVRTYQQTKIRRQKTLHKIESQKAYVSMAYTPYNAESPRGYFGDSSQLTNWIVESGATCHITPEISNFILGSLLETDKYIEFSDGHFVTAKQRGEVQIKMGYDNGKLFIARLYNILLAPDFP